MPQLFGREAEIGELRAAYAAVTSTPASRIIILDGAPGSGKSALADRLEELAAPSASILRARAYPIDRFFPLAVAERLASDLREHLERTTRERPAVVIVTDAQCADEESLEHLVALARELHERPLLVVLAHAGDERAWTIAGDATIALRELDDAGARALARAHYAGANGRVLDAIVANARGIPYEIVTIAGAAARRKAEEPDAVDLSSQAAIAKELAALAPAERTARQMAALLSEPNDHALTAGAILETIPMKIPLHRRILAAMERRGVRTVRERFAFAQQAIASADKALAQRALCDLAFAANEQHCARAVIWASEHHLELGEPPNERFVEFYSGFFNALVDTASYPRAESIAAHALSEAQRRGLRGLGALAAQLISAQESAGRPDAARSSRKRYAAWLAADSSPLSAG
ncbi:MAG TPA: ATP-binding protein [Candidatus Acidoferrales bacterium]|nr:ATP-binding protein [Candidatus Acidoferrales bacterium]